MPRSPAPDPSPLHRCLATLLARDDLARLAGGTATRQARELDDALTALRRALPDAEAALVDAVEVALRGA